MSVAGAVRVAEEASSVASAAAARAGVEIIDLTDLEGLAAAEKLFGAVWAQGAGSSIMPLGLLRAMAHSENYVVGAFAGGEMRGAAAGFLGGHQNDLHLHSHILAVRPGTQDGGVGYALKQHQRAWSLSRGIDVVYWTFDPLVSRNAYFNLTKLGAEADNYFDNFYGVMEDAQNAGEESDRLLVAWRLGSEKAVAAAHGYLAEPAIEQLRASGAAVVLDEDEAGAPRVSKGGGAILLCRVPHDIVQLRLTDSMLAREWRLVLREALGGALARGFALTGVTRTGWYVLIQGT